MVLALRRVFLVAVMVLALLAGLFGWTMRMQAPAPVHHSTGLHSSTHTLAMICPPPPFVC
jgi:hypothetical protein